MKLDDVDFRNVPQELLDFKDQVITLINNGKYQMSTVSSPPSWNGRRGETVIYISGNTGRLYACTVDGSSTNWAIVSTFTP